MDAQAQGGRVKFTDGEYALLRIAIRNTIEELARKERVFGWPGLVETRLQYQKLLDRLQEGLT